MTFYGQEDKHNVPEPPKALREFTFQTWGGKHVSVKANYMNFMADHILFYKTTPADQKDTLVLGYRNVDVNNLKEVIE